MVSEELKNLRILIVDGDQSIRSLIRDLLNAVGINQVDTYEDGARAYSELRGQAFDIVIVERRMEPLDGIALTRMIRTSADSPCPHIPILMMTSAPSIEDVTEARDAGVNEFLIKPFSTDNLTKRLAATVLNPREFVQVENYFGPDRRRVDKGFIGEDRRRRS